MMGRQSDGSVYSTGLQKRTMKRANEFSLETRQRALIRQMNRCGSCGTRISALGGAGQAEHKYGESAQAHHIRHIKLCGSSVLDNCVILCWSCHYCVHEGGNYRGGMVIGEPSDFPHLNG